MALKGRETYKVVISVARWLAGLPPLYGRMYYFERYKNASLLKQLLNRFRGTLVCPFCGKRFLRSSAFVTHVTKKHISEIEEILSR